MYKSILIPTDGSELSEMAVRQGIVFAKSVHAKVTALTVSPPFHTLALAPAMVADTADQYRRDCVARSEQTLAVARKAADGAGVAYDQVHIVSDHPYQAIIDVADRNGCDLIFMASHGRKGMSALLLGSETTKVLTHSKIPVLVYR
ncbi:MAG TPA: universal stress protein [Candidatus Methylomirabilis sp.]|nr:universal stress protein [Candidatus Methylomirabilis sp.]